MNMRNEGKWETQQMVTTGLHKLIGEKYCCHVSSHCFNSQAPSCSSSTASKVNLKRLVTLQTLAFVIVTGVMSQQGVCGRIFSGRKKHELGVGE